MRIVTALATTAVLGVTFAGCGNSQTSTSTTSSSSLGAVAGYTVRGRSVRTVAATWRVPRIGVRSGDGAAFTWIGADVVGRGTRPFIQVGTCEDGGENPNGHGYETKYFACWSDTTRGYSLAALFAVRPGDTVTARLTLDPAGASVAINDRDGRSARFATAEGRGSRFTDARFIQEDVTNDRLHKLYPYPRRITPTAFTDVKVNGKIPATDDLIVQEISENGDVLAPGPLQGDSFALRSSPAITS